MYSESRVHSDIDHGGLGLQSLRVQQQCAHDPIGEAQHYYAIRFINLGNKEQ